LKRFSAQWTEKPVRLHLALLLSLAFITISCVSEPQANPESSSAETRPEVVALTRQAPEPAELDPALPDALPPAAASSVTIAPAASAPTDITVLSVAPAVAFAPFTLPEPAAAPAATKPAATVAPAAVKPATTTAPAATKPAAAPAPAAAKPATTTAPAATSTKPAAAAAATPATAADTAAAAASVAKPQIELPAAPASSARSVVAAATTPTAETRISTVRGERFELRFPGTGWVYLGDESGQEGLKYETRRFEDTQAVFTMNPEAVGEYLLRFHRQNPVDQSTEVSLVRVVVSDKAAPVASAASATAAATTTADPAKPAGTSGTSAAAPASSTTATPQTALAGSATGTTASAATAGTPAATGATAATGTAAPTATTPASDTATASAVPLPVAASTLTDPVALIKLARDELGAKRVQNSLEALDRYLSLYPYGTDELFYLYGLAYEQDTPFRNIKKAYENYRRVRDEYPRSARWQEAADRVSYLERHYFGLR